MTPDTAEVDAQPVPQCLKCAVGYDYAVVPIYDVHRLVEGVQGVPVTQFGDQQRPFHHPSFIDLITEQDIRRFQFVPALLQTELVVMDVDQVVHEPVHLRRTSLRTGQLVRGNVEEIVADDSPQNDDRMA